jgi:stage V sporulation protein SpoVS
LEVEEINLPSRRVSSDTDPVELASDLVRAIMIGDRSKILEMDLIGASSLNQAIKAIAIANSIISSGKIVFRPHFVDGTIEEPGEETREMTKICLRFWCEPNL